jgi:hypothetical protein
LSPICVASTDAQVSRLHARAKRPVDSVTTTCSNVDWARIAMVRLAPAEHPIQGPIDHADQAVVDLGRDPFVAPLDSVDQLALVTALQPRVRRRIRYGLQTTAC